MAPKPEYSQLNFRMDARLKAALDAFRTAEQEGAYADVVGRALLTYMRLTRRGRAEARADYLDWLDTGFDPAALTPESNRNE